MFKVLIVSLGLGVPASVAAVWNNPYPAAQDEQNILYSSFSERPKHLDPVRAYSSDEYMFIAQIYEPPLQYHFLRRPYTLVPLTTDGIPEVVYFNREGVPLSADVSVADIAYSEFTIRIRAGILYQPHPAFAADDQGVGLRRPMSSSELAAVRTLADFQRTGTRELTADDYVYQIKRMANPQLHCPIAGVMGQYIVGFSELSEDIARTLEQNDYGDYLDLRRFPLTGVTTIDRYTYRIRIKGKYPQFLYWQAMPFFAPMPWEADRFYSQAGLQEKNISLDWFPVGTGPFMLTQNNPNLRMVLDRNPNFRSEQFPMLGQEGDAASGLLADAGRPLPFIDRAIYSLEKESIPRWNKFLQGYYDHSGISSDSFDQAIQFSARGDAQLTERMRQRGIGLSTAVAVSSYYMGFNMLHAVLGGDSERARKLRRALSIAVDFEEFIAIFTNGRGVAAQGPIPPGIFGNLDGEAGVNPYVYDWIDGRARRKPISVAKALLREAGYPNGMEASTGKPLVLHFEAVARGPDDKARLNWLRKQMAKLSIQLVVRATDYNRFREKMLKGTGEIFFWGWNADYPDPENFLFLLYGPNAKALHNGENASNYENAEFDELFSQMKNMENGARRQAVIDRMLNIVRRDAPWMWGFHPQAFSLHHAWIRNMQPNLMANNTLKYVRIDPELRAARRLAWNEPVLWPMGLVGVLFGLSIVPAVIGYRRREKSTAL